jgi:hypothetical protein
MQDSKVKVTSSPLPTNDGQIINPNPRPDTSQNFEEELIQEQKSNLFPNNIIALPSKGLLYEVVNPLSKGTVEMKFMTTKEENILTTESYIKQGVVIDKFLQSMVISPKFNYDSLLIGDKDALIVASRIYGYGEIYPIEVTTPSGKKQKVEINLEEIENKEVDESLFTTGENRFNYAVNGRNGKFEIEFKLLTVGDQKKIDERLKKYKTAGKEDRQISARLQQMITSVNGNSDANFIQVFVENDFLAKDSRAFRDYVSKLQPGPNMEIELTDEETGDSFRTQITIGPNFFWPDI